MPRNAGDYVKSWGAGLIRGAASNPEFTVMGNATCEKSSVTYVTSNLKFKHGVMLCAQ